MLSTASDYKPAARPLEMRLSLFVSQIWLRTSNNERSSSGLGRREIGRDGRTRVEYQRTSYDCDPVTRQDHRTIVSSRHGRGLRTSGEEADNHRCCQARTYPLPCSPVNLVKAGSRLVESCPCCLIPRPGGGEKRRKGHRQTGILGADTEVSWRSHIRKGFPLTLVRARNRGYLNVKILGHSSLRGKRTHTNAE